MKNTLYIDLVDEVIELLYQRPNGADEGYVYGVIKNKLRDTPLEGYEFSTTQRIIIRMKEENLISSYSINTGVLGMVTIYQLIDEGVRIHEEGGYMKHYELHYHRSRLQRIKRWFGFGK